MPQLHLNMYPDMCDQHHTFEYVHIYSQICSNYCSVNLISPNGTKCLVFLHDKQSVLCTVKSEFLYITGRILDLKELVLQLEIIQIFT
jgi:nitrous oxide reductase accessory protein NosL